MRRELNPPKGVTASVVGLPALAADANDKLGSPCMLNSSTLALALLAIFLVLMAVFRSLGRALAGTVTVALARAAGRRC